MTKDWTFSKIESIIFSKIMLMLKLDYDKSCVFLSVGAAAFPFLPPACYIPC
jgi:hypothetical protein